jgi:hypothetical protein
MARSLLRQLEQIRQSSTYDDDVSGVNTPSVAEPTVSGSLEDDTNVIRTLLKQLKGTTNWYDEPPATIASLNSAIAAGVGEKYTESVSVAIAKNTEHTLPNGITYTPDDTAGQEGSNMDVYIDGQLLSADTGTNGVNADRDYGETTTSGITFRFDIQEGRNLIYIVRE